MNCLGYFAGRNSSSNTENHGISVSHTRRFYFIGNKRRWHSCTCNGNNAETTNNAEGKLRRESKRLSPLLARYFWKRFIGNVFFLRKVFEFSCDDHYEIRHEYSIKIESFFCLYIRDHDKNFQSFSFCIEINQKRLYFVNLYLLSYVCAVLFYFSLKYYIIALIIRFYLSNKYREC